MRSGDRPGLQNRRVAGNPVTGGFDPHSLPPIFINNFSDSSLSLTPDDSLLLFRDAGTSDVYALDWEEP